MAVPHATRTRDGPPRYRQGDLRRDPKAESRYYAALGMYWPMQPPHRAGRDGTEIHGANSRFMDRR
jgi:hypothetical protein